MSSNGPKLLYRTGTLSLALMGGLAMLVAVSSASVAPAALEVAATTVSASNAATTADQSFADAPYGVDPIVTGPVSPAFKQRRAALGCDQKVWPDAPAGCYPE